MIKLTLANTKAINYACLNFHYAKRVPVVALAYNVYYDDNWCGVICYGWGANRWIASSYNKWNGQVLELIRVALNGKQKTTSECLSATLREIKNDAPCVDLIVSYADLDQEHKGIIYQATNWIYTGLTNEDGRSNFIIHGKKIHPRSLHSKNWKQSVEWLRDNVDKNVKLEMSKGKHKYLFPLNKKTKKQLEKLSLPYPK